MSNTTDNTVESSVSDPERPVPSPADVAAKTQGGAAVVAGTGQDDPADDAGVEAWKSHARLWESRARQNHAEIERLKGGDTQPEGDGGESAGAKPDTAPVWAELDAATARANRYATALEYGLDKDIADTLLTASDPEALSQQAQAVARLQGGPVTAEPEGAVQGSGVAPESTLERPRVYEPGRFTSIESPGIGNEVAPEIDPVAAFNSTPAGRLGR